tara:strand:- start:21937 stop:22311 length:375 start_codon:yes stop_codon:yes gene_type:complete
MTMHLVRPYLSTTRYNIRKPKLTAKDIEARKEHEKFLKKMGVGRKHSWRFTKPATEPTKPVEYIEEHKLSNRIGGGGGYKRSFEEQRDRLEVSKQFDIGPAYNKGPYQVLSREDSKDPSTGKRR